jgi:hypothetical protein
MGMDISLGIDVPGGRFERNNGLLVFLTNTAHWLGSSRPYFSQGEPVGNDESALEFEHLMLSQADHAHEAAIEVEALVLQLPIEKSR